MLLSHSWEWPGNPDGGGTPVPSDWHLVEAPEEEGRIEIKNVVIECYRAPFGTPKFPQAGFDIFQAEE
ncbi:MAG: hypothetical protein ACQKBY_11620 [Verrucomicrobiales bacterium]